MVALLGWVGNIFLLWGVWEIGNKKRYAHLLTVVGEGAWIGKCLLVSPPTWDLAVMCGFFAILAWRCWVKWAPEAHPYENHELHMKVREDYLRSLKGEGVEE